MKLHITLDYELFLDDRVGTVENSLITPMHVFHNLCKKLGVRATIFVDAAYLYRLDELRQRWAPLQADYEKVVANIQWLESQGYDIELHIHPQWYYSTYDEAGWHLDWEHYKLSSAPYEESERYFAKSKQILDELIGRKTQIFRAGGYSIQQFDYVSCFQKHGILADSSVLTKRKNLSATHYYDYTEAPADAYRFTDDILRSAEMGDFIEFPISCSKFSLPYYMRSKKTSAKMRGTRWGDGGANRKGLVETLKGRVEAFVRWSPYHHATIDCNTFSMLLDIYQANRSKNKHFVILGHPKGLSSGSLQMLEQLVLASRANGDTFTTLKEII